MRIRMATLSSSSRPTTIDVRLIAGAWRVLAPGLHALLAFSQRADAERVAFALARRLRAVVRLFGAEGELVSSYREPRA